MARFFLHLREGADETLDPAGREFPEIESLPATVVATARDPMGATFARA